MADIKVKYPSTSSVALSITLASLASSSTLLAGRSSAAVDNSVNLDLDHLVAGHIKLGTSPTAPANVEVWAYGADSFASGTPTWPDVLLGTDAAKTITSANVKMSMLRLIASMPIDATTGLVLYFPPTSIAALFGAMPMQWALFVTHNCTAALDSTGGNHAIQYMRQQAQSV